MYSRYIIKLLLAVVDSETNFPSTLVGTDGVISSLGSIIMNHTCTYTSFLHRTLSRSNFSWFRHCYMYSRYIIKPPLLHPCNMLLAVIDNETDYPSTLVGTDCVISSLGTCSIMNLDFDVMYMYIVSL